MLVHSLPVKRRKRLACDIMNTAATLARSVHDVTDLVKMACSCSYFHNIQILGFRKLDQILTEEKVNFLFHSY